MEKRNNIYEFSVEIVENTAKIPCDNEAIVLPWARTSQLLMLRWAPRSTLRKQNLARREQFTTAERRDNRRLRRLLCTKSATFLTEIGAGTASEAEVGSTDT